MLFLCEFGNQSQGTFQQKLLACETQSIMSLKSAIRFWVGGRWFQEVCYLPIETRLYVRSTSTISVWKIIWKQISLVQKSFHKCSLTMCHPKTINFVRILQAPLNCQIFFQGACKKVIFGTFSIDILPELLCPEAFHAWKKCLSQTLELHGEVFCVLLVSIPLSCYKQPLETSCNLSQIRFHWRHYQRKEIFQRTICKCHYPKQ